MASLAVEQSVDRSPTPLSTFTASSTIAASMEPSEKLNTEDTPRSASPAASVRSQKPEVNSQPQNAVENEQDEEDESQYPTGIRLALVTLALCLAVLLVALDQTIIATAIPKITDEFKALSDVAWYASAYMLTTASFQLLFGKFYTFFSVKWVYIVAIAIFELGSLICGAAPNSTALIVGRAVAGWGSAGIFSGSLIIIAHAVPLRSRPIYTGVIGAMWGIASVAGPLMGGVFTDKLTWRWCFYINLPIGAVTVLVIAFFFKNPRQAEANTMTIKEKTAQLDILGTAIFIPGIICLLLALQWGGSKYDWNNGRIIALLILFAVLMGVFIFIQFRKQDTATLPPRILKQRSIAFALWFSFCAGSSFLVLVYYLPIWFQAIKGVSAIQSGINNLPSILALVVASLIAGGLITALGQYVPFMIAGAVLAAIGAGLLTTFTPDTGSPKWIGYQILYGFGIGLGMQQPIIAAQRVLSMSDVPIGTSVIIFSQTIGGAIFIAIAQNIFTNKLIEGLKIAAPQVDPAIVLSVGATSLKNAIPKNLLPGVIVAYNDALTTTWRASIAMACFMLVGALGMEWKSVKGKKVTAAAA